MPHCGEYHRPSIFIFDRGGLIIGEESRGGFFVFERISPSRTAGAKGNSEDNGAESGRERFHG